MTPFLAQHFHMARERRQHMQVFLALGDESGVERARRGNVSTRFVVQSFLRTPGTAHISNKLRADHSTPFPSQPPNAHSWTRPGYETEARVISSRSAR